MYAGEHQLVDGVLQFLRDGIAAEEPTLVVLAERKIAALNEALGRDAEHIQFADMDAVGANPGRIIPAWREFVDAHPGRRLRGIGEPIWAARSPAEMSECHRHEALLNVAFADTPGFWLLCPTTRRRSTRRRRPTRARPTRTSPAAQRRLSGLDVHAGPFTAAAAVPDEPSGRSSTPTRSASCAASSPRAPRAPGLGGQRAHDFLLAVNEIAGNSVRHGGGQGVLGIWQDSGTLLCDVQDAGRSPKPLAGRERPEDGQSHGYGLWLANQLCDLVQVRTFPTGNVVRLHMHRH